jgi:hypothetical protein
MDVYVAFTILYINVSPKGLSIVVLLPPLFGLLASICGF